MRRVYDWLNWSPFPRGSWSHLGLSFAAMVCAVSISMFVMGDLRLGNWLLIVVSMGVGLLCAALPMIWRRRRTTPG